MNIVNETLLSLGWMAWKIKPPQWSATFVLKGAFALRPGGVAIVTTEQADDTASFALRPSGRFVHHGRAAATAFAAAGLVEIETRTIVLRHEHGAAVAGTLTRAKRRS